MSLRDTYRIYKHTSPNGKVYIGVTREENLNRRWQNGKGYESCPLFWNAIQKYGWDSFIHEVIEEDVPIEQINERESYWIAFYKSNNRDFGYNIEEGGHAYRTFSDETRKKISDALKGRTKTPEHREKLRQANLGKKPTQEAVEKSARSRWKAIVQLDLDGNFIAEYSSIKEACEKTGAYGAGIAACRRGEQKTHHGYRWIYKEDLEGGIV